MMHSTPTRAEQAAFNNASWCDAVCRAHGSTGIWNDDLWLISHATPRFYPNAVTITATGAAEQVDAMRNVLATTTLDDIGIKDSFCALDLAPLGMNVLFEATWLWRSSTLSLPPVALDNVRWATVLDAAELAAWETAWNGPADDATAEQPRTFLPALLNDPAICFIAAYRDAQIVAGAIVNSSAGVAGISNVFAPVDELAPFFAGCIVLASEAFPDLPLVDYEHGDELAVAQSLGFEPIGPLRVWGWTRPTP